MDDSESAKKCTACGAGASGWKCAQCGTESTSHADTHACGSDACQPKCSGCGQAESQCPCATEPAAATAAA